MHSLSLLGNGLMTVLTVQNVLLLLAGVMLGMVVGVVPGFGPSSGMAVLLPLTFTLEPSSAIIMLAAIYYGSMYGGTITAVLINTPGETASIATTFDGYPLARQGRAGPVLVIAAIASFVAGTVGAILLTLLSRPMANFASTFGPPELFLAVVAGLLALIVLTAGNRLMGALSALIGFAIATVGVDVGTGQQRFTFGSVDLINGISFLPVAIGVFGVAEVLYMMWQGKHLEKHEFISVSPRKPGFWPSKAEYKESAGAMARGSVLGFGIGVTPGSGATVASLVSYTVEKTVSKTPERFGKGAMAGVAGPEAANNGASAGSMVPMLTLGIPGSGATAVLLGGFLMWGLQPGPLLMTQNPEFAWALIASMYLGNVVLLLVNIFCIPAFASIGRIPFKILGPIILIVCAYGTYAVNSSMVEVQIMMILGVLGFFMQRYGFSAAALVIAVVLGELAEATLRQTMIISDGSFSIFLERGTSVGIIIFIVALVALPLLATRLRARKRQGERELEDALR